MRFFLVFLLSLLFAGCDIVEPPAVEYQPQAIAAEQAEAKSLANAAHGETFFADNCAQCHRTGAGGAPELNGVTSRISREKFEAVLDEGPKVMPSWKHLPASTRNELWAFLGAATPDKLAQDQEGGCGCGGACDQVAKEGKGQGKGCGCGGGGHGHGHGSAGQGRGGQDCGGGCGGQGEDHVVAKGGADGSTAKGCGCGRHG